MTNGYIIASGKQYLSREYQWRNLVSEAHVFPEWQMPDVLELSEGWPVKPTHLFAATFENGTVTIGEKFTAVDE